MIHLTEAGLDQLAVHAVVRAANDRLGPAGAASRDLDEAGGPDLARQLHTQAPLEVGSAIVTGGGDLAAEFVLHLVVEGESTRLSRDTVRRALESAWHRAEAWQLPSVATRLSGLSLPSTEAVKVLMETFQGRPLASGFPADLYIVLDDADQRALVEPWLPEPGA